jgi:hypothetical protein
MINEQSKSVHTGTTAPTAAASSLSSTMRLPMEEFTDPDAEMHLDVRSMDEAKPCSIRIDKKTYEIGRRSDAGIPLMQPGVSRQHARLFHLHSEEIIEDLNSTNGTYVNGVRITRCVLQNNDVIRIGDATLLFTRTAGGCR